MARDQTFKRKNIYKDFDLSFNMHPLTRDVGVKLDANAINQSLKNLISTNYYERPFQPEVGCNIRSLLFELATPITVDDLRQAITETVNNYEPRVELQNVYIEDRVDINSYHVEIHYTINTEEELVKFTTVLQRLR